MILPEHLQIVRTLLDFGIVIVVWLAQVIMYPCLAHIEKNDFVAWHKAYCTRISFFVVPLLCGQAVTVGVLIYLDPDMRNTLSAMIILLCWLSTFGLSVPCHNQLQEAGKDLSVIRKLVWTNLIRTLLWSIVFMIGVWKLFQP